MCTILGVAPMFPKNNNETLMCVYVCVCVCSFFISRRARCSYVVFLVRECRSCKRGCPYAFSHCSSLGPTSCCATIPTSLPPLLSCVNMRVVDLAAMFVQKTKERAETLFLQIPCVAAGRLCTVAT